MTRRKKARLSWKKRREENVRKLVVRAWEGGFFDACETSSLRFGGAPTRPWSAFEERAAELFEAAGDRVFARGVARGLAVRRSLHGFVNSTVTGRQAAKVHNFGSRLPALSQGTLVPAQAFAASLPGSK